MALPSCGNVARFSASAAGLMNWHLRSPCRRPAATRSACHRPGSSVPWPGSTSHAGIATGPSTSVDGGYLGPARPAGRASTSLGVDDDRAVISAAAAAGGEVWRLEACRSADPAAAQRGAPPAAAGSGTRRTRRGSPSPQQAVQQACRACSARSRSACTGRGPAQGRSTHFGLLVRLRRVAASRRITAVPLDQRHHPRPRCSRTLGAWPVRQFRFTAEPVGSHDLTAEQASRMTEQNTGGRHPLSNRRPDPGHRRGSGLAVLGAGRGPPPRCSRTSAGTSPTTFRRELDRPDGRFSAWPPDRASPTGRGDGCPFPGIHR